MRKERRLRPPEAVEDFRTIYELLTYARDRYGNSAAYRQIETKKRESAVTFAQLAARVDALRVALCARGLCGTHAAIIGESSAEWVTAYLAITAGIGAAIPIDRDLPAEMIEDQLRRADADAVFVSAACGENVFAALKVFAGAKLTVAMRGETPGAISLEDLIAEGETLLRRIGGAALPAPPDPDDLAAIVYTSGTTGSNKGVTLTNRNILGTLRGCARLIYYPSVSISVLPIHHTFELHAHLMSALYCGTTVCFNDSLKYIRRNLVRFSPEMSCMVPQMLEFLVKNVKNGIADSGRQSQFDRTLRLSAGLRRIGIDLRRQLFASVREPLGGNLSMVICGGAPLSQETADWLDGIGVTVYNGYGITECAPVAAVNPLSGPRRYSAGMILPTLRARVSAPDETGSGEIQLKGDCVTAGYYNLPADTAKIFTEDGWLKTGDLGYIDRDGFLFIRGRLKNLIILPNGKNVCPEELEEAMQKKISCIRECIVFEDADSTGIFALCYVDPDFRAAHGLETAAETRAFLRRDFDAFNRTLPSYQRIRDFDVSETDFEKTSTQKIRRFKVEPVLTK